MNNQLLTYVVLKNHIIRAQQELGYEATITILARIIEETYDSKNLSDTSGSHTRTMG